ncbi:MAG: septal ring lytic transglycosylase RlpA family protein [Phormidesmis sp.]
MFVLSNGSIKQRLSTSFTTGLTAAALLSGVIANFSVTKPAYAASDADVATRAEVPAEVKSSWPSEAIATNDSAIDLNARPSVELAPAEQQDTLVHTHTEDGRRAATLYIQDIPVLTFIGTNANSLTNSRDALSLAASETATALQADIAPAGDLLNSALETDPALRATHFGEQLSSDNIEAADISVRWNESTDSYIVTLAGEDLIALDSHTLSADSTENEATDALQVANRLRRLVGGAEPLAEIEGLPEPVIEAVPAQSVAIVSSNVGGASWYGPGFNGRRSASGEVFNQNALTAAHRTLPFGTRVLVTNLNNGRQVTVRINDRGPFSGNRIIDLSAGAAAEIGLINAGVGTVQLDVLAD